MPDKSDIQITLFVRHEKTGRYAFNAKRCSPPNALVVDPAEARERGYPLKCWALIFRQPCCTLEPAPFPMLTLLGIVRYFLRAKSWFDD